MRLAKSQKRRQRKLQRVADQGVRELKGQQLSYGRVLDSKASNLAALRDQTEQARDEEAKLSQDLAELEHRTDEISQRDVAQQELVKKSHEEADTSKQLPIQSYWCFML